MAKYIQIKCEILHSPMAAYEDFSLLYILLLKKKHEHISCGISHSPMASYEDFPHTYCFLRKIVTRDLGYTKFYNTKVVLLKH